MGHERQLAEAHDRLSDPGGPRLVLVRGERGTGRTEFVHAVGELLRAEGAVVLDVGCVPGDDVRPFLLALRLIMALEEHRPSTRPATEALRAAERRDGTAMAGLLRAALTRPVPVSAPVVVVMDDIQHADAGSLTVLRETDFARVPHTVRLLASEVGRGEGRRATGLGTVPGAHPIVLPRLGPEETTTVVARRLRATPDTTLARRVRELTLGVPGAVDALLTGWTRQGAVRVADGHAFVGARSPTPVLSDNDRFMTALDALGEPCRTVVGALSILWPLGDRAAHLIATSTGLPPTTVNTALHTLTTADLTEPLPAPDSAATDIPDRADADSRHAGLRRPGRPWSRRGCGRGARRDRRMGMPLRPTGLTPPMASGPTLPWCPGPALRPPGPLTTASSGPARAASRAAPPAMSAPRSSRSPAPTTHPRTAGGSGCLSWRSPFGSGSGRWSVVGCPPPRWRRCGRSRTRRARRAPLREDEDPWSWPCRTRRTRWPTSRTGSRKRDRSSTPTAPSPN